MDNNDKEMFIEMYIFENNKLMDQLEQSLLSSEQVGFNKDSLEEIFRIMHTIKGSSNTMGYEYIGKLAHTIEDILDFLRGNIKLNYNKETLYNLLLEGMDAINNETSMLQNGKEMSNNFSDLISRFSVYLTKIKEKNEVLTNKDNNEDLEGDNYIELIGEKYQEVDYDEKNKIHTYYAKVSFMKDCAMKNIRAFEIIHNIKKKVEIKEHIPYKLENTENENLIKNKGFQVIFQSKMLKNEVIDLIENSSYYLDKLELFVVKSIDGISDKTLKSNVNEHLEKDFSSNNPNKKVEIIGVNVEKLDKLMDITSEIIITEAILIQNPDLSGLKLRNFKKTARHFNKITNELQDIVMSIRMVSLSATFNKLKRLTRDMAQKLDKKVRVEVLGEKTEVDKNIIESITDPLIHLLRNSIDHGIEDPDERIKNNKEKVGILKLEAKNVGGEVWISIEDDGKGLNKEKILSKAIELKMIEKNTEISDKEIYSLIFKPGFSTKEKVSEYSGRGVGMDIVMKNIEKIFGTIDVESEQGKKSIFTIKIPLTLAIIKGITVCVGNSKFTAPVDSIEEVIILKEENIVKYPDGSEIVKIREKFYNLVKFGEKFNVKAKTSDLTKGTTLLLNSRGNKVCLFVDELIGEQQVVVKPLPKYINNVEGIAGCTLLGDGTISLILDIETISKLTLN
ncbi:MAG: chemotaxis protein CheA [Clostridiales bacterium]